MEPPFPILPTQSVAAASGDAPRPPATGPPPQLQRMPSPPRGAPIQPSTMNVDLQFGQVVSQRHVQEKELDDLRATVRDKDRAVADLQESVARLERQNEQLRQQAARREDELKDQRSSELATYKKDYDKERKEMSNLLAQARQQVRTLTSDLKSKQVAHVEEVRRLQQENKRLEMISDQCKNEAARTINGLELELDKQTALMAELEKQLNLKEEQVKKAKKEVQRMTDSLEKVAKELVSRNKERDDELLRRQHQASLDAKRSSNELASLMQEKRELVRTELRQKEEILLLKAQWDKAQTAKAELQEDINALEAKLEARDEADGITQRELSDALTQLESMKQENNRLHAMVDRLNEQLHAAAEGSQLTEESLSKLKDDVVEQETKLTNAERDRAAFAGRVVRLAETTAAEVTRLIEEVDEFRIAVREAAVQHAPQEARDVELELLREQARERERNSKRPATSPQPHGDEHACISLMNRLRDDIIVSWEDLRVLRSDVGDEQARFGDLHVQHTALKEAYIVDREHLATLTTNLNEANVAYANLQKEKQTLLTSLKQHDTWMKECVELSNERDENQAKLLKENDALKEELGVFKKTRDVSKDEVREVQARLDEALDEIARLSVAQEDKTETRKELEETVVALTEETRRLKKDLAEEQRSKTHMQQKDADHTTELRDAEAELQVVKNQLKDKAVKYDALEEQERATERENKTLRDENFRLRDTVKEFEGRLQHVEDHAVRHNPVLSRELSGQMSLNHQLRGMQDEADAKIQGLELEKRQLGATVSELKKEVQVLWSSMQQSNTENHHYREALSKMSVGAPASVASYSPALSAPRDRRAPSPSAGLTPVSYGRSRGGQTPADRYSQEDALKSIEERVTSLLSSRGAEMAMWDR